MTGDLEKYRAAVIESLRKCSFPTAIQLVESIPLVAFAEQQDYVKPPKWERFQSIPPIPSPSEAMAARLFETLIVERFKAKQNRYLDCGEERARVLDVILETSNLSKDAAEAFYTPKESPAVSPTNHCDVGFVNPCKCGGKPELLRDFHDSKQFWCPQCHAHGELCKELIDAANAWDKTHGKEAS